MAEEIDDNTPYSLKSNAVDANDLINKTHSALRMDIAISVYFIVLVMIMGSISYLGFDQLFISLFMFALIFSLFFIFTLLLRNAVKVKEMVDQWMSNNAKISRALRYEMMPSEGQTNQEKAKNIAFALYQGSDKYYASHPDLLKTGKTTKSGFTFDLVCRRKHSLTLIKFIEKQGPVMADDLSELMKASIEYGGGVKRLEIIAISGTPFDAGALSYAEKADMERSGETFDLVRELDGGYFAPHVGNPVED